MKCHGSTGVKFGDPVGGMDVAIPLEHSQHIARQSTLVTAATHTGVFFIGLMMIGYISGRSKLWTQESVKYQQQLEEFAYVDSLTGLFNRRHFFELAEQESTRTLRHKRPLSILMIDIDEFKKINDIYGHTVGDKSLQELSDVFRQVVREVDMICRMGGEEFIILLTETDQAKAVEVAERLRALIESTKIVLDNQAALHLTISIGVATLDKQADKIDAIINLADGALYEAKRTGRNKVCVTNQGVSDLK